tara:strand:+ start:4525 stop:4722 length:198 start_codon:yes stop_codon:yes gene_type:complete
MAIKRNLSTPLAPSIFDKEKRKARKAKRKARREHRKFLREQHEAPVRRRDLDKKGKAIYDKIKKG